MVGSTSLCHSLGPPVTVLRYIMLWSNEPEISIEEAERIHLQYCAAFPPAMTWEAFPIGYIKSCQVKAYQLCKDGEPTEAPRFHYGFLLTGEQIQRYGDFCRTFMRAVTKDEDEGPDDIIRMDDITWYMNWKLEQEGYYDDMIDTRPGETLSPDRSSKICSFLFTGAQEFPEETDPELRWPDEERLHAAVAMCKKEIEKKLGPIPEAKWYFCLGGFGPANYNYAAFDENTVFGEELLKHLPPRITRHSPII
ncbi:hypothetical protein C8Q76DRAFT_137311 [Earliella scabrosa]|nr:hypothetical protein C8Q76DRAFT_137311 [Earliella scabrosa]